MWRIWFLFEPRRALIGLHVFLAVMALLIHFILLSSPRYNWLGTAPTTTSSIEAPADVARPV